MVVDISLTIFYCTVSFIAFARNFGFTLNIEKTFFFLKKKI